MLKNAATRLSAVLFRMKAVRRSGINTDTASVMSDVERRKLSQARVADLRAELEKRGLDKTGIKAVLVERLVAALTSDGLSNSEIDDYVVEAANDSSNKRQPKRGVTPSKSKEEDEIMGDLDDKSEVLDYGDTEELEKGDEAENTKDGAEESAADTRSGGDDFQVLDEEAFENDAEEKEEQQESALEHDDSIDLGLNEDMLIEEEVNSFGAESDASAALSHNKKSHQQDKGRKNQSEKEESSLKSDKQHHQDSSSTGGSGGGSGDVNSRQSEKKSSSSPRQESERSSKSVAEKAPSSESNQQQQHTEQDGVNGDKSRSCGSPKDRSKNSNEEKRESSPSAANSSGRNLWVSGLSSSTRATDLKQTFSKYGKVLGAKVVTNARTPGARCYGFVTMAKKEDALRCIQYLDRTELHGRMISVEKARGEATGPGRVKTPSPTSKKEGKTEERESEPKKESKSSGDHKKEDRRDSREKTGSKPVRQRITAPSPGPSPSERSDSRSDQRSEQGKKRLRSPSPRRPVPPRRVNHSPGGGLHTRRSTSVTTPVLTFASIKQARERQRLREREREDREHARRREEEARRNERRQREEQLRLEREKEELRKERERIEQARKDILRLEREKARLERERLEWEREELQRQQQKLRELAERPPPVVVPSHPVPAAPVSSRSWSASNSYSGVSQPESRYVDARRSTSSAVPNKRQGSHHTADYYEERSAKRPAPSSDDRRVGYDTAVAPPPPRFNTMQSSTSSMKRPSRDHEYPHRSSSSSFERSSNNIASSSVPYDRSSSSSSARRDAYFPSSSSSGANRVVEPTRREAEPSSRGKDDRYRDSYRPPGRDNDRAMASRGTGDIDLRGPPPSSSSSSSRPRRYPDVVASGISASSGSSRDPWLSRKNDSSGSGGWNRGTETSSGNRWSSTNVSSRGSTAIYGSSLPAIGISMGSMAGAPATSSSLYASSERFDAYKTNLQNLRKY